MSNGFSGYLDHLRRRLGAAAVSSLRLESVALREYLGRRLQGLPGGPGALVGSPVFESLFEYEPYDVSLEQLGLFCPT